MKIDRPIVFFDLETTGTSVTQDYIVEISLVKVFPDGATQQEVMRVKPGKPIPAEATAVHHISDDDVKDKPTFREIAPQIVEFFKDADIAGFNSNKFDLPLLVEEMVRAEVFFDYTKARLIDVQTIFHKKEPRTLTAAYRFYCDKELEGAHSALADTMATYEVFKAQMEKYNDLPDNMDDLAKFVNYNNNVDLSGRFIRNDKKEIVVNFGKHKGRLLTEVFRTEPSYLDWIEKGDFPADTKLIVRSIYNSCRK